MVPPELNLPWVESPFFQRELGARGLSPADRSIATEFHDQGYVVLEGAVPAELCDAVRAETERLWVDDPGANRQPDGWRAGADSVRELAVLPGVLEALAMLYGRRPLPFQTLNFKRGTEQLSHSDSIHFSSIPARFMCGVWVALEDVTESSGPLFYHPGSHRLPETTLHDLGVSIDREWFDRYGAYEQFQEELMAETDSKPVPFLARKGDALVWSSNIVHGGSPIFEADSTRWSQVTHYLFEDCIYYQPHSSLQALGELRLLDITDLVTMQPVPQRFLGQDLEVERLESGRSRLHLPGTRPVVTADAPVVERPASARPTVRRLEERAWGRVLLGAARGAVAARRQG